MHAFLSPALHRGQTLSWFRQHPGTLRVLHGRVWVTIAGDPQDYFLGPGARLELPTGRYVVVEAQCLARVTLRAERAEQSRWGNFRIGISGLFE